MLRVKYFAKLLESVKGRPMYNTGLSVWPPILPIPVKNITYCNSKLHRVEGPISIKMYGNYVSIVLT